MPMGFFGWPGSYPASEQDVIYYFIPSGLTFRRTGAASDVYYDGTYMYVILDKTASSEVFVYTDIEFLYTVVEFYGKMAGNVANSYMFTGAFYEPVAALNGISPQWASNLYCINVRAGGVATQTTLTGQDWTTEHKFKIDWSAGSAKLYIDGVLVNTTTTNVPSVRIPFCVYGGNTAAGSASNGQIYNRKIRIIPR